MLSSSTRVIRGSGGGDDAGKTLVERRVVRTGAVTALSLAARHRFLFLAAGGADHAGRRQQFLQVDALARRAARLALARHEGLEVLAASTAGVFKQGHNGSL